MTWHSFLLHLFGAHVDHAEAVTGSRFAFRHSEWIGAALLAMAVLGVLAWWSYRRDAADLTTPRQRSILTGLRITFWLLLVVLLLRPVLVFTLATTVRRTLILLIDASASMGIEDPRYDEADRKRAAIAAGELDARDGLDQGLPSGSTKPVSRKKLLTQLFAHDVLKLQERLERDCELSVFTFGQTTTQVSNGVALSSWIPTMGCDAKTTALGDAVRDVLQRKRGQPLAGIVIFTDGASNTGSPPLEVAREAAREKVPLLNVGLGVTSPRDVIIPGILVQDTAFLNDELPVAVRIRAQGLQGQSGRITLKLGGEVIGTKDVQFTDDAEQSIPIPFTPTKSGEFELQASIDPRPDEAVKENNVATQRLRVIDARVKVLYVESAPRWEFRYIQSAMLRDRRLEAKYMLLESDPSIAEAAGSPYLAQLPPTKEALFGYDLLMIGDVTPDELGKERLAWIEEFVSKFGGSCLVLAGPRASPHTWKGTPLEKLLPVELGAPVPANPAGAESPERGTSFELTAQGRIHPFLQLGPSLEENAAQWKRFGRLFWVARVGRGKAGAQVLLNDNDPAKANRAGKMPIVALHQYGLGQVLFVGTDNTWRWRRNTGEGLHAQLWGQVIQKLGMQRVLGGSRRTQLSTDKQSYSVGDRIAVFARLYQADFTPVRTPQVEASVAISQNEVRQPVSLRAVAEQPGTYRGEFMALAAGIHRVRIPTDPDSVLEIPVTEPRYELGATAMNEPLLRQMAELSNGAFFREENLITLPEAIRSRTETVQSTVDAELWSSPFMFILLTAVPVAEWVLRKRWQLK